jgi:hypothetical protein
MAAKSAIKRKHASPEQAVDTKSEKTIVSYFQLSDQEMQGLGGISLFEKSLLSSLVHTLRLGVHLDQKVKGTATELDERDPGYFCINKYIASARASDMPSDKLFPLRLRGPSMKSIVRTLPVQNVLFSATLARSIFQLCIWRAFAFGDKDRIRELTLEQASPDLTSIGTTICAWGGISNIAVRAYGNFQVVKGKVPSMLSLHWEFSQTLSNDITTRAYPYTFAELHENLCKKSVPSIPRGGIIIWVFTSDFSEYELCFPPTAEDLARHIKPLKGPHGSPSGPSDALKHIAAQSNGQVPKDADTLAKVIRNILEVLNNPPEHLPIVRKLVLDCEGAQGRKLGVVDMEHALRKITRQIRMAAKGSQSKKQKV